MRLSLKQRRLVSDLCYGASPWVFFGHYCPSNCYCFRFDFSVVELFQAVLSCFVIFVLEEAMRQLFVSVKRLKCFEFSILSEEIDYFKLLNVGQILNAEFIKTIFDSTSKILDLQPLSFQKWLVASPQRTLHVKWLLSLNNDTFTQSMPLRSKQLSVSSLDLKSIRMQFISAMQSDFVIYLCELYWVGGLLESSTLFESLPHEVYYIFFIVMLRQVINLDVPFVRIIFVIPLLAFLVHIPNNQKSYLISSISSDKLQINFEQVKYYVILMMSS